MRRPSTEVGGKWVISADGVAPKVPEHVGASPFYDAWMPAVETGDIENVASRAYLSSVQTLFKQVHVL